MNECVIHLDDISATGCFSIIDTQLALYRSIQNHGLEQVDKMRNMHCTV
jgi:hypothetical protein